MADLKAKSRDRWRKRGYYVQNGETMMRAPGGIVRRHDHLGFADLVAIALPRTKLLVPPPEGSRWVGHEDAWVYIQSTSWANVSARLRKIQTESVGIGQWARPIRELAEAVLEHNDLIVIEGWRKKKGSRLYELRERWVTLEDLV